MKKHKARRKQRQARQTAQTVKFNPRNAHRCMSESCRRAGKCLGRAMICGCTVDYVAVANETDAEKLASLRKALDWAMKRIERREALGLPPLVPGPPIYNDPNATEEQIEEAILDEIKRKVDELD